MSQCFSPGLEFFQNVDTALCELSNNVYELCNQQSISLWHSFTLQGVKESQNVVFWVQNICKLHLDFVHKDISDSVLIELPVDQAPAELD